MRVILLKQLIEQIYTIKQNSDWMKSVRLKIILAKKLKKKFKNSKKLSKYVAAFDYIDKMLIILSAASGGVSIISFTTVIGAHVGIASKSFP